MLASGLLYLALIVILSNLIVLLTICFWGIRLAKIRILNIIYMRQYFISMLSTVIISYLLPPTIAAILFIAIFLLYRKVIFKNDSLEVQRIYVLYDGEVQLSPPIPKFSCIFNCKYMGTESTSVSKDYLYSFSQYLYNAIYIFVFYCAKGVEHPGNTVLYGLEFFIAITALFLVIAKSTYHLFLSSPTSLFFLQPNLSYIPVILIGILFYGLAILIFITTL